MMRAVAAVLVVLSSASAVYAQDHLLPTDVANAGEVWGTLTAKVGLSNATIENTTIDADFEAQSLQFVLEAGIGLGKDFEIAASLPTQPWNDGNADGTFGAADLEIESKEIGFGDMDVRLVYAILRESLTSPQLIVALLGRIPTGSTSEGTAKTEIGGVQVEDLRAGGLGEGAFHYGVGAGVSKELGGLTVYGIAQFLVGGTHRENGVTEDMADVLNFFAGAQIPVSDTARLDIRFGVIFNGDEVTEDAGLEEEEEAHWIYAGGMDFIVKVGLGWSLVVGASAASVEDHELSDLSLLEMNGGWQADIHVGLHFNFGGSKKR